MKSAGSDRRQARSTYRSAALCIVGFLTIFGLHRSPVVAASRDSAVLSVADWEAAWTRVLRRHVDSAGRIDFAGVARDRADLDRVVGFIAAIDPVASPTLFPDVGTKLAYYINAYNALAMYGVVDAGVPERFGAFGRLRFFYLRTFTVGGRSISLYDLENKVIRPLADPRVHFALNCMVVSCPRLPRAAFTAENIDRELDAATHDFVGEKRNVRVEPDQGAVYLSAIFDFYTDDFLKRAPNLIAYINRYRAQPMPNDYTVRFLDYDWTINDSSRLAAKPLPSTPE